MKDTLLPPKHLRADTAAWFSSVTKEYDLDSDHVRVLTKACEAWDGVRLFWACSFVSNRGAYDQRS
jgi:hypothetical protein